MEAEFIKGSVVRSHHVYKDLWRPVIGQLIPVLLEPNSTACYDKRSVIINLDSVIIDQAGQRALSRILILLPE